MVRSYVDKSYVGGSMQDYSERSILKIRADARIWTNIKGETVPVHSMSVAHINNCVAMIERASTPDKAAYGFGEEWLTIFAKELNNRNEKNSKRV